MRTWQASSQGSSLSCARGAPAARSSGLVLDGLERFNPDSCPRRPSGAFSVLKTKVSQLWACCCVRVLSPETAILQTMLPIWSGLK